MIRIVRDMMAATLNRPRAQAVLLAVLSGGTTLASAAVIENEKEFITVGDFNGDGQQDIALVDKDKGRVRLGYRVSPEFFNWMEWRPLGVKSVTGVSVGHILSANHDSLAAVSANATETQAAVFDAPNPALVTEPLPIQIEALGPNTVVAADLGGEGNTPLLDLYVSSMYNSDPDNRVSLFRADGKKFTQTTETGATGVEARGNRVSLKNGGAEYVATITTETGGNVWRAESLASGKPETVLSIPGLANGSDYVVGDFRGAGGRDLLFYKSGEPSLTVYPITEEAGKFKAGAAKTFTLAKPITQLATVDGGKKSQLLAVFGETDSAELLNFDAATAPVLVQDLSGYTNKFLHSAITVTNALVLFSWEHSVTNTQVKNPKTSSYQAYALKDGKYVLASKGGLPGLDDRDDSTVPEIHKRIVASLKEKSEADMQAYTNAIPGTDQDFEMAVIPGGEFVMGSSASEKERKADEGPQHRVKISPFWMAKQEVTWKQFLLFVYEGDEKKLRELNPTPEEVNRVSDAVTRPSKPYVDMSFDMGKSKGLPAIAMTQHAANKYCHWLSAKTGHFYRLATEAEWEYACRAGTTNAYSFGDDAAELPQYGWFFDNSNSKYQKIGKKTPNPWGLYDMHGNVAEWVLDQYDEKFYASCAAQGVVVDPWNKATKPYPHVVRGGSWDDDAAMLRSAARFKSGPEWKLTYPNLPKTVWWLSDCTKVGFRIVRPLKVPSPEEMAKYWISGVEKD